MAASATFGCGDFRPESHRMLDRQTVSDPASDLIWGSAVVSTRVAAGTRAGSEAPSIPDGTIGSGRVSEDSAVKARR